jgi:regulator of protease activity HflC (stomatin/prohibitin superfamily)
MRRNKMTIMKNLYYRTESGYCKGLTIKGKFIYTLIVFGIGMPILLSIISILWLISAAHASYLIWQQRKEGEAELAKATYSRQILVQEAKAKEGAAILLAQAEVERAKGVAKANKIIGQSLNNNESYLRYLWIHNLQNEHNQVIYVPTEANLPILEAHRFMGSKK